MNELQEYSIRTFYNDPLFLTTVTAFYFYTFLLTTSSYTNRQSLLSTLEPLLVAGFFLFLFGA